MSVANPSLETLSPEFNKLPRLPPREELINGLEVMLPSAHKLYYDEHVTPHLWSTYLRQSILDIGIITVAKVDLMPEPPIRRKALIGTYWLPTARKDLRQYIAENPEQREFLTDTILFDEELKTEQSLTRFVYSSIVERKMLDPDEFAAEVIKGIKICRKYQPVYKPISLAG